MAIFAALKSTKVVGYLIRNRSSVLSYGIPALIILSLLVSIFVMHRMIINRNDTITNLNVQIGEQKERILTIQGDLNVAKALVLEQNEKVQEYRERSQALHKNLAEASDTVKDLRQELRKALDSRSSAPESCEEAFNWLRIQAIESR